MLSSSNSERHLPRTRFPHRRFQMYRRDFVYTLLTCAACRIFPRCAWRVGPNASITPTGFTNKFGGCRDFARVDKDRCELISRRRHRYQNFVVSAHDIAAHLRGHDAVLDDGLVFLDAKSHSVFDDLLFCRGIRSSMPRPLWPDDKDLRGRLLSAKARFRKLIGRHRMSWWISFKS
jgi:hypothetical protein